MKKLLLLLFCILISAQSFGQDPDIYDDWNLHNLIIDGESHIPNHLAIQLPCAFYYQNEDFFYFPTDYNLWSHFVEFGTTSDSFVMTPGFGLTDWICHDQPCQNFFSIYKPFYDDYFGTVMNYEIIHNSNDSKTLIVTNIDGDQAIYNTKPLLLNIPDHSQISFIVTPNPVSETLFISSENLQIENLTIYNLAGQTVLSEYKNVKELNVSSLSAGLYFIEITSEVGKQIQQFIKQ